MAHLLHVDSSALSAGSVSKEIAVTFRKAWQEAHPDGSVVHLDLGLEPVPPLAEAGITAPAVPTDAHTRAQAEALAIRERLVNQVVDADAYLFAVPMYNWGIPAAFKAWIDQIMLAGRTFTLGGPLPLAGRPATVILSYGGGYDPGTPRYGWDFVQPYLETVLGKAIGLDVTFIKAQLTLAEQVPAMADLIPAAREYRAAAHKGADAQARDVVAKLSA
ncbi:NAD(P)H-dependent oxidoreductase [Sphaerisporangium flaviroseum]|uniref:FMN dependent NADH:quinone oxidoreductase n=1 Tax=Sphaerisporangium flaviroseum TaxID=509199 RepID=A0ABP7I3U2_9ACTN